MIFIDRARVPAPDCLVSPNGLGDQERSNAEVFYSTWVPTGPKYDFKVYRHKDVTRALTKLFRSKCAYCESSPEAAGPMDREHFRPKGEVKEDPLNHPGYWWLAATWENLLLSCPDCNKARNLKHRMDPTHPTRKLSYTSGKHTHFPLAVGGVRALASTHALALELPLLLEPTVDDPSKHLDWNNDYGIVIPIALGGQPDLKGEASIKHYGLNRIALVKARHMSLMRLKRLAVIADKVVAKLVSDLDLERFEERMDRLKDLLLAMDAECHPKMSYSACCSALVTRYRNSLRARLGNRI